MLKARKGFRKITVMGQPWTWRVCVNGITARDPVDNSHFLSFDQMGVCDRDLCENVVAIKPRHAERFIRSIIGETVA